jgi:hypothetical protein
VTIFEIVALTKTYKIREGDEAFLGNTGECEYLVLALREIMMTMVQLHSAGCSTTNLAGHLAKYVTYLVAALVSAIAYGSIAWVLRRRQDENSVARKML